MNAGRPRVAMLAYACDPEGSGEHWLGWGWAEQAAHAFDLHLITTPKSRAAIERHATAAGITPHFVEPRGPSGSWRRKFDWHRRAAHLVSDLHSRSPFAVVHATTFHTFRVPFHAASLGIPAVWGPIAGGEQIPRGFEPWCRGERLRPWLNRLCLSLPAVRRSLRAAKAIFVSNHTTLDFLPSWCRQKCQVVPPNALREDIPPPPQRPASDRLSLLYAGNCVSTRCIPLVVAALERLGDPRCTLTVVGDGPMLDEWRQRFPAVRFAGRVERSDLSRIYNEADVFVFPALRDSGGSALLEAMSLGLPVVCLDWAGPAEIVDATSGMKISVANPEQSVAGMAAAFAQLRDDPATRVALAAGAVERARSFTWAEKRRVLEATYLRLAS